MDFGKAFGYPFEDEDWLTKLGIAFICTFVPFAQFALAGWSVKLIANVKTNQERPLPAWDDLGGFFMRGIMVAIGNLLYSLPGLLFICIGYAVQAGAIAADDGSGTMATIGLIVVACCGCLGLLVLLFTNLAATNAMIRYSTEEAFSVYTDFGGNIATVRANLGKFVMAYLYTIVGSIIPFTALWVPAHILGQLGRTLDETSAPAM